MIAPLLATAVLFMAIFLVSWGLSFVIDYLNGQHRLPAEIYTVVTHIELWLVYVDVVLSAVVLLAGAVQFIKDIREW